MSDEIIISEAKELADPKVLAIARRVLHTMQMETERAVLHCAEPNNYPISADPNSVENIMLEHFSKFAPEKQRLAVATVKMAVGAPPQERMLSYGDLAKVDLKSTKDVSAQVKALPIPDSLKTTLDHLKSLNAFHDGMVVLVPGGATPQQTLDHLELRIFKVKCLHETRDWGYPFHSSDEISLGGLGVDETGDTTKVNPFNVSDDFDTGEVRVYDPPKRFISFNLREGTTWPKTYCATLVLAERDWGGFGDFIDRLWKKVGERIADIIKDVVGTVGGLWGIVIDAAIWVLEKLFGWLISALKDDVFPPVTVSVKIPALNRLFDTGKADSRDQIAEFQAFHGRYQVIYDWHLHA